MMNVTDRQTKSDHKSSHWLSFEQSEIKKEAKSKYYHAVSSLFISTFRIPTSTELRL